MNTNPDQVILRYEDDSEAVRLDRFVASALDDLSRTNAARLIRDGLVTVNGTQTRPSFQLRQGDLVRVERRTPVSELIGEPGNITRILETPNFLAIDKPAGIVMHPGAGTMSGTLAHHLLFHYPELFNVGHPRRPGIVHRLDKGTSGVVLVARTPALYTHLSRLFEQRKIHKRYLLFARGIPESSFGRINASMGRHPTRRTQMAVVSRGRPAETTYRVIAKARNTALIEAVPLTGRTHQIRVHMAAIGHPILGDTTYGKSDTLATRPLLHAWTIQFDDLLGSHWTAAAPLPEDFQSTADALGICLPQTPESGLSYPDSDPDPNPAGRSQNRPG